MLKAPAAAEAARKLRRVDDDGDADMTILLVEANLAVQMIIAPAPFSG
jgi:hypothetical protein